MFEEIRARLAALPNRRSWHVSEQKRKHRPYDILDGIYDHDDFEGFICRHCDEQTAYFIARAPEDIAVLLAKVDEQAAEIERLKADNQTEPVKHGSLCTMSDPSCQCVTCAKDNDDCCTMHSKPCRNNDCPDYEPEATL